jgi:AcrR family transcriptional regulator
MYACQVIDKRTALLETAARIVTLEGPDALSIRRLAADAGTSTMALYTWFEGKPGLMRALFRECFARFTEKLRSVQITNDPYADLLALGRTYRRYALDNPNFYEIMFGRSNAFFEPEADDIAAALDSFLILVDAVGRVADTSELEHTPEMAAQLLWATAHGAVSLELVGRPTVAGDPEQVYELLMRTVMAGLASPGAAALSRT